MLLLHSHFERRNYISTRYFGLHTLHHRSLDWNRLGWTPHRDAIRLTEFIYIFSLGTKWVIAFIWLHSVFEALLLNITCQKHVDRIRVIHARYRWVPRSCIVYKVRDALPFFILVILSFDFVSMYMGTHPQLFMLEACCSSRQSIYMYLSWKHYNSFNLDLRKFSVFLYMVSFALLNLLCIQKSPSNVFDISFSDSVQEHYNSFDLFCKRPCFI